jgi:hypothetical protein
LGYFRWKHIYLPQFFYILQDLYSYKNKHFGSSFLSFHRGKHKLEAFESYEIYGEFHPLEYKMPHSPMKAKQNLLLVKSTRFLLGIFFRPEDIGDRFFRIAGSLSAEYTALYPKI